MKICIAAVAAIITFASDATGQSVVQKSDWKQSSLERFLPEPDFGVPWLRLDTKTKLPKGDLPIGPEAPSVRQLVLGPGVPEIRFSANAPLDSRRM